MRNKLLGKFVVALILGLFVFQGISFNTYGASKSLIGKSNKKVINKVKIGVAKKVRTTYSAPSRIVKVVKETNNEHVEKSRRNAAAAVWNKKINIIEKASMFKGDPDFIINPLDWALKKLKNN